MELVAKYHVETDLPIAKAAEAIAAEQSIGTWIECAARTIRLPPGSYRPVERRRYRLFEELFEPAGNLFGLVAFIMASLCNCFSLSAPRAISAAHQPV